MPEQQPGGQPPAGQVGAPPPVPTPPDPATVGHPPVAPDEEPDTDTVPVVDPSTEQLSPARWSGAAPVPASSGKRRRWRLGGRDPEHPDPTPHLPPEEDDDEPPTPVDPWADADPPWEPFPPGAPLALPPAPAPAPPVPHQRPAPYQPTPYHPAPPHYPGAPPYPAPHQRPAPPHQPGPHQPTPPRQRPVRPTGPPPAAGAPPGWGVVPPGYEMRRRRRRWPRRLTALLLTFGCCCAGPVYFVAPIWQQYPASASAPDEAANMTRRTDPRATRTVRRLETQVRSRHLFAEGTFAAVYNGGPGWDVIVYGTTGFRLAPKSDLAAEITRLTEVYRLTDVRDVDAGALGGYQRCGVGFADGDDLVLCAWADHGSLGVATFSGGSLKRSAATLRTLREAIVSRQ